MIGVAAHLLHRSSDDHPDVGGLEHRHIVAGVADRHHDRGFDAAGCAVGVDAPLLGDRGWRDHQAERWVQVVAEPHRLRARMIVQFVHRVLDRGELDAEHGQSEHVMALCQLADLPPDQVTLERLQVTHAGRDRLDRHGAVVGEVRHRADAVLGEHPEHVAQLGIAEADLVELLTVGEVEPDRAVEQHRRHRNVVAIEGPLRAVVPAPGRCDQHDVVAPLQLGDRLSGRSVALEVVVPQGPIEIGHDEDGAVGHGMLRPTADERCAA